MAGAVVVGVGPGIGRAVARRFAREGLPVALVARRRVEPLDADTVVLTADAAVPERLGAALDEAAARLGPPEVVVYNAALVRADALGELSVDEHQRAWAVNVLGALTTAEHVLPGMAARGRGSFLVTGGMPEPVPGYVSLSLGKAAARTLVDLLDRQYRPAGVHVAMVTVAGAVAPGTAFDPDDIAEHYWRLHTQPRERWVREVVHG
ncbi:SDR family NAD(P)-dependent oxidoreductase [Pseudonocardia humida]|uniref:SDR family NAD(P)-dependent oxidoreductase n=1 Tax=Pseudonocardia humida TaxID=2800819 RepID=A0ABT0ZSP6_9PSEU|nr:SDR family NAD(P)-dependent oxidoreductase [Pseudonocardia humida]MCO1653738.1 SDR family NAD(P)-dependent oxidoreductase [Pseudonocardia humida]